MSDAERGWGEAVPLGRLQEREEEDWGRAGVVLRGEAEEKCREAAVGETKTQRWGELGGRGTDASGASEQGTRGNGVAPAPLLGSLLHSSPLSERCGAVSNTPGSPVEPKHRAAPPWVWVCTVSSGRETFICSGSRGQ